MKIQLSRYLMAAALMALVFGEADAQTRKKTTPAKKTTTKKTTTTVSNANLAPTVADTAKPVPQAPKDPLALSPVRKSMRNDGAIDRNPLRDRNPLAYEHIREDDAWYRQRVWREIDIREKINQAFGYRAEEDNGDQRFIYILLNAIKSGEVTAFDAIDDRFTTPLTIEKIGEALAGKCETISKPDLLRDPNGNIMKDTTICNPFNPASINKYMIKEEWVFDKESSRMYARILGIAPMKVPDVDFGGGMEAQAAPVFWVYYPDLRSVLSRVEVYNPKNFGARMSWEELFESRFFSSRIIKSTIENPNDLYIFQQYKDGILALLEGENIKEKIFNYEQDLWSY